MIRLAVALCLLASPAVAQGRQCFPHEAGVERLADKYGEQPIGRGLTKLGTVAELFVSEDGDTWTILQTWPSGRSCLVTSGVGWEQMEFEAVLEGRPL